MHIKIPYRLNKYASIGFAALLCFALLLGFGKCYSAVDRAFVVIHPEIHAHISNFLLSILACLLLGTIWLLFGVRFRFIALFSALMILANFACETLMGFMNTTDILDAIYGSVGVAIVFVYLFLTKRYGLLPRRCA